jgi:hypothetical protein
MYGACRTGPGRAGRKPIPTRHVLEAVLWILNTGVQWHMLPQSYPNYETVHRHLSVLLALLPIATKIVDYGAEGWLWTLVRSMPAPISRWHIRCRRHRRISRVASTHAHCDRYRWPDAPFCLLARCGRLVWQEPAVHLAVVIMGLSILCISPCIFKRGDSRFQPPEKIASVLPFVGRRTQLAGSELFVQLVPDLSA